MAKKKTFEVTLTNTIVVDVEATNESSAEKLVLKQSKNDEVDWKSGNINAESVDEKAGETEE